MNRLVPAAVFALLICSSAIAAAPSPPTVPKPPSVPAAPVAKAATPPCDPRASADYVAGVDVKGRSVAPADLPSQADVQISTEVYAELRSPNPQLKGVGVVANLPGLAAPACPPPKTPHK